MFLRGYVSEDLEPILEDVFLLGQEENIPLAAILDAGFNGMLCLPTRYRAACELELLGIEGFELADGTLIQNELYLGYLVLNDEPYPVELILLDIDMALVGMQLLLDRVATFDMRDMRIEVI